MPMRLAVTLVALMTIAPLPASAAQSVYLSLRIDGNDIVGASPVTSLDREDTIECLAYEQAVTSPRDAATGRATGRRQHGPIKITKRIDQTSPLILKALCNNEPCEATFRFYAPHAGAGIRNVYTVEISSAYVSSVRQVVPAPSDDAAGPPPLLEEVELVFRNITFTYEVNGATHTDTARGERSAAGAKAGGADSAASGDRKPRPITPRVKLPAPARPEPK